MKRGLQASAILGALASGEAVSGQALAARFGVTRAAVWKQVAALRALGLPIAARTGAGYQLPWPTQLLDAVRIAAELGGADAAPVQVHWALDSTQDELTRQLPGAADLTVVMAEHQRLGRGRRGRGWLSPPGLGIHLSCLKHFATSPAALSGLSVAVGVCVVRALGDVGVTDLQLKWPNDVLAAGAKLAGTLIEVSGEYEGPCVARVGVGLNVRLPPALRAELTQPAADLAELCGGVPPDRNRLAARLIAQLRVGLLRFEQDGLAAFADDFARLDALADQPLTVHGAQGAQQGVGRGLDARGALRVATDAGIIAVHSGEVSVRLGRGRGAPEAGRQAT